MIETLSNAQITAIKKAIELGRTIRDEHPEIANMYREGDSVREIMEYLSPLIKPDTSSRIFHNGTYNALTGHSGSLRLEQYDGLLDGEEARDLGKSHQQNAGVLSGNRAVLEKIGVHARSSVQHSQDGRKAYLEQKGVHSRTLEQMQIDGKAGGLITGPRMFQEGRGVHGLSKEQRRINGNKGAIAQGKIPWTDELRREAYELSRGDEYRHGSKVSHIKIAERLNGLHPNRGQTISPGGVKAQLRKYTPGIKK